MPTDDQNPGQGGAGEALEPIVPAPEPAQGSDPLDDIKDPQARADAKKYRAIVRRNEKKPDTPEPPAAPTTSPDVVTKTDIARIATTQAKKQVSPELLSHWDELTSIPLAGYDPLDADSIASNMQERFAILKARTGAPASTAAADLQVTHATGHAGKDAPAKPELKLPGYSDQVKSAKEWYAPKS